MLKRYSAVKRLAATTSFCLAVHLAVMYFPATCSAQVTAPQPLPPQSSQSNGSPPGYALAGDSPKAHAAFYVALYGDADPKANPNIDRALRVFERVRSVADKRIQRLPQLRIVASDGDPWAVCLPDGNIVLSQKAVEICYQGVSPEQGDARMAFVLGHELGHMADDDFWHMNTYMALTGDPQCERLRKVLEKSADVPSAERETYLATAHNKEMRADDRGFMYAAIAGYPVETLVASSQQNHDFFNYWVSQIPHARIDELHPAPIERARLAQLRLRGMIEKVDFFKFGVRLAYFDRYEDAIYFFEEFQSVFPSREVFSNLGYCYLKWALQKTDPSLAYQYWLPMVLDLSTRVESFHLMGHNDGSPQFSIQARKHLEKAADYLERASAMDKGYLPARINLAVAYFYLGEEYIYQARAAIEQARKLAPENLEVLGLRALIIYQEGKGADTWPEAVKVLEELAQTPNAPPAIHYNLAVLTEERGRSGKAQELWKQLAAEASLLPAPYRRVATQKAGGAAAVAESQQAGTDLPWKDLPVAVGQDLLKEPQKAKILTGCETTSFNWGQVKVSGHIYRQPGKFQTLEMNDFVEMVVLLGQDLGTADAITGRWGSPLREQRVLGGQVLSYGPAWAALVQDGQVREVWVAE